MNNDQNQGLDIMDPNQARFHMPDDIYRVTAGIGGESFLIDGGEKTAIYDCGMAYCHEGTIKNIKEKLKDLGKTDLDYVILSHSHYDHIGALPYILSTWPKAQVVGAEKLKRVFSSDGAKATMKRLGEAARDKYLPKYMHDMEIETDGLRVDIILKDGDMLPLGKYRVIAISTPGHTDCSMSYLLKDSTIENHKGIMFMSESVGVLENENYLHTSILKSFQDTVDSANKCRAYEADILICSHYGVVPKELGNGYFDLYIEFAEKERDFILGLYDKGFSEEEICPEYEKEYWNQARVGAQPIEAFRENAGHTIRCIINSYRNQR